MSNINGNTNRLIRIAEAIADGADVDWAEERRGDRSLQGKLRQLRAIESIRVISGPLRAQAAPPDALKDMGTTPVPIEAAPEELASLGSWGPLRLERKLGEGAYGEVFVAHDPSLQTDVALKLIREDLVQDLSVREAFIREARQLAKVRHENVLIVHGADEHDGRVGLWTELIRGKTLEDCLEQQGPFGAREATHIGLDLVRAVAAVHGAGLVHRDIKTTNVMREQGGRIVLMDFSTTVERPLQDKLPATEQYAGTALYMAPELFRGKGGGPSADIYALGVLLYRLVTGDFPVKADSLSELREKQLRGDSNPLRDLRADLPGAFIQVVERALAHKVEDRYRTAGEMERALNASLGHFPAPQPEPSPAPSPVPSPRPPRPLWKRLLPVFATAGAVAVALLAWKLLATGPFEVQASVFRTSVGSEERLLPGARVMPGDQLFLELQGTKTMYVYVLNEDDEGHEFLLFPLSNLDLTNPLPSGEVNRLPGPVGGRENYWDVTSAGGKERFYVIASRKPLEKLEKQIAELPQAGSTAAVALPDEGVVETLRGIGGLAPEPQTEKSEQPLARVFDRLSQVDANTRSGVWTWALELDNPPVR